jgi:peroxiredoxin
MFLTPLMLMAVASASPEVGAVAPDFTAQDTDGKSHTLSKTVKDETVVLAFFPKAFTAG